MPAAPSKARSKLEDVYETVKQRIADGTYPPGRRLILDQLAREMSVSAVPVREALRRLEAKGYVEFERNVGPRVVRIDPEEYVHTMHILALLEGHATALAAAHLPEATLKRARELNQRLREMAEDAADVDAAAFRALNREFHFTLYEHCPHEHLRTLIEGEWDRLDTIRSVSFVYPAERARTSAAEHEILLDLLTDRAASEVIERVARQHKLHTIDAILRARDESADEAAP